MTRHDWADLPPSKWYDSGSWKRRRAHQLRIVQPLCEECLAAGKVTAAQVADHHPPHGNDWCAFLFGPLRSLCLACHDHGARFQQHRGFKKDIDPATGWPVDERHPCYTGVVSAKKRP
jgi:hypothetical protein